MRQLKVLLAAAATVAAVALLGWLLLAGEAEPQPRPGAPGAAGPAAAPRVVDLAPSAAAARLASESGAAAEAVTAANTPAAAEARPAADPPSPAVDPAHAFAAGVVRDPEGRPLRGAIVTVEGVFVDAFGGAAGARARVERLRAQGADLDDLWQAASSATTGEDGRFALAAPADELGLLRLHVAADGFVDLRSDELSREAPPAAIDVWMPRGGAVRLTLRAPGGAAPADPVAWLEVRGGERVAVRASGVAFAVTVAGPQQAVEWSPPGAGGAITAVLRGAPPGTHALHAWATDHRHAQTSVTVPADGEVAVDLVLDEGLTLAGRVVDAADAPIAGAQVWAQRSDLTASSPDALRPLVATSDEAGRFVLRGLEDGEHFVGAHAEGFIDAPGVKLYRPGGEAIVLRLDRGRVLRGRVVVASGGEASAAGLHVELGPDGTTGWGTDRSTATTDEAGAFVLEDLAPGRYRARARGHGLTSGDPVEVRVEPDADPPELVLEVRQGLSLSVTVVDEASGRPVVGARIGHLQVGSFSEAPEVSTDGAGQALLTGLCPGEWKVWAASPDHATRERAVAIGAGGGEPLRLSLAAAAALRVRVLDAADAPAAGQQLYFVRRDAGLQDSPWEGSAVTDDEGRCELRSLPAGTYRVQLLAQRGLSTGWTPLGEVTARAGETTEAELRLVGASVVRGRVVRGARPLEGAVVVVHPEDGDLMASAWAQTDRDGRFEVVLGAGRLVVSTPGAASRTIEVAPGGAADVSFDVRPGLIAGRVLGADGAPAAGARVVVRRPGADEDPSAALVEAAISWADRPTDAHGRFELERVRPGRLQVVAVAPGAGVATSDVLELGPDDALTGLDLRLVPGGRIEVLLTRADGAPAAGAHAAAYHLRLGPEASARFGPGRAADSQGRVVLDDVLPGEVLVVVTSATEGLALGRATSSAGAAVRLDLTLRRAGALAVSAPPGARFTLELDGGPTTGALGFTQASTLTVDATGELTVPGLPAGVTFVLRGTAADGRALGPASVVTVEGGSAQVELR